MRPCYSQRVCGSNHKKIFTKCFQPIQRCLRRDNLRNLGLFTSPNILPRWSYSFRVCFRKSLALFLFRSVGFYIETLSIYLDSLDKLTYKIAIAKVFKCKCLLTITDFCFYLNFSVTFDFYCMWCDTECILYGYRLSTIKT